GFRLQAIGETLLVGLLLGLAITSCAGRLALVLAGYFLGGVVIGLRHSGGACPCWLVLGGSLYAVQVTAIVGGWKPAYVASDVRNAERSLAVLVPAGFGLLFGTAVRAALAGLGWFRRQAGPPVRFFPRTTRELLLVVACFAVAMACIHRMFAPPTI